MNRRDQLIELVEQLSGPLGPFVSPAQREADRAEFLASVGYADVAVLTELLFELARTRDPDDMWTEQREFLAQEALTTASHGAPEATLATMVSALDDPLTRGTALDVIGALGLEVGIAAILGILADDPTEDDLVRAAAAVGEIGGAPARAALEAIGARMPESGPLREEVEAATRLLLAKAIDGR